MNEWQLYAAWPWQKIRFDDGTSERGPDPVYRRKVDHAWQYRRPTAAEMLEYAKWWAIR
jgi:hypothetical protein